MRFIGCMFLFLLCAATPDAKAQSFGAFSADAKNGVIRLDGDIDAGSALDFRRALKAVPEAELLVLNSGGGLVAMALLIADDVHSKKLSTIIPLGSNCYSACSLIFLAGHERQADGELGVHQISNDTGNLISAQNSISDILDVLNRFNTPIEVLTIMFKTPPKDMYVFSSEDIARIGINRRRGDVQQEPSLTNNAADTTEQVGRMSMRETVSLPSIERDSRVIKGLSAIEGYARRSNRLAVYHGLDFFGADIGTARVGDASSCALECFKLAGQCKAFTYNTDERIVRGPNCFLKEQRGARDGNVVAISGELLRANDQEPRVFSIGVIDPNNGVYEQIDLPGGDLSSRPHAHSKTAQQCRLACAANIQCIAFTYVKSRADCWLKGSVGTPRFMDGAISGLKTYQSFEPTTISLE